MNTKDLALTETHSLRSRASLVRGIAFLFLLVLCVGCGPIGPFSGGRLSGEEGGWQDDWNNAADVTEIQLETGSEDPHSVNLWIVVVDHEAYVATSLLMGSEVPEEREWVRNVTADPRVRIRVEEIVYPAQLESVDDPALRARLLEAYQSKYPEVKEFRGESARFYRVVKPAAAEKQ